MPDLFEAATERERVTRMTSIAAYDDIKPKSGTLRDRCIAALTGNPSTADEVAALLGKSVLSIRPRFTELSERNIIVETGEERANRSGKLAMVWRLNPRELWRAPRDRMTPAERISALEALVESGLKIITASPPTPEASRFVREYEVYQRSK